MNKRELILALAAASDQSEAAATRALNAFLRIVESELSHGDEVAISGFGTFRRVRKSERAGRNPQTGEPITIPARNTVSFAAGLKLKAAVKANGRG